MNPAELPIEGLLTDTDFKNLIGSLYREEDVSLEEKQQMKMYMNNAFNEMQNESIEYDRQNAVDMYVDYLANQIDPIIRTPEENALIGTYESIINAKHQEKLVQNKGNEMVLKLVLSEDKKRAAFTSIVLLEVTILVGILLSAILLAIR